MAVVFLDIRKAFHTTVYGTLACYINYIGIFNQFN
jgi:hypothetical protein